MNVLVDTSVWSEALRRARPDANPIAEELSSLVRERRVVMMGPVRQELLSGLRDQRRFDELRTHLRAFPDLLLRAADYEDAAEAHNLCRAKGIQGSNTDFLICAAASRRRLSIFTTDQDFVQFAKVVEVNLHAARA